MAYKKANKTETVNLTNCDLEPIHIPGAIQPHGLLILISKSNWLIKGISKNLYDLIKINYQELLGEPLTSLLTPEDITAIQHCLDKDFEQVNPLKILLLVQGGKIRFDGIVHCLESNQIILELEPCQTQDEQNFFKFYQSTKRILTEIQKAGNLSELCTLIVKEVRRVTSFDRVMIYQFDSTGAGTIIAEEKLDQMESYLGLHYPDSDIPKQAKHLYTVNILRLIPQVDYQKAEIITETDEILDLSFSVLRSVSPIHIEYLKNMGVEASMSISIIIEGRLWGLIVCHHNTSLFVPYEIRSICEFIGQIMSLEIVTKEANEDLDYKIRLKSLQIQFINDLSKVENFIDGLQTENLLAIVNAQGAVIYNKDNVITVGQTPPESELYDLIDWLGKEIKENIFVTDSLPKIYPKAESFKNVASGLLALCISSTKSIYIMVPT